MSDKLVEFQRAEGPLPERNRLWPLQGVGLENLGNEGQPVEVPMPKYGPDELLVRHDACGLCFSDIKVIRLGPDHPRIRRDMRDVRVIGHSGSAIDDLRLVLEQTELGRLAPNRSVAAIGSLGAARDGLRAVAEMAYPGRIVIYPHIQEMPLTTLPDLKETLPSVYARLRDGREWTVEAEREFLRLMLC